MTYAPATYRPALGATNVGTRAPTPGSPQPPIYPLIVGNNGAFLAVRASSAQGSCGTKPYPCKHPGTDVNGRAGTQVVAPESGVIVASSSGANPPFQGYGPWLVVIKGDASGKYHLLAHLATATAAMAPIGRRVTAGDVVGTVSSANHVHWELRKKLVPDFARGESNLTNNSDPVGWLLSAGWGVPLLFGALAIVGFLFLRRR